MLPTITNTTTGLEGNGQISKLLARPVARGVQGGATHSPDLPKGPLLATKWAKNGVFVAGLRGARFKKSTFRVQKLHFWGVPYPPKSILAMGLLLAKFYLEGIHDNKNNKQTKQKLYENLHKAKAVELRVLSCSGCRWHVTNTNTWNLRDVARGEASSTPHEMKCCAGVYGELLC